MRITKAKLEFIFGLVQLYRESLQYLRGLRDDEKLIRSRNRHSKNDVEDLRFIKKQKEIAELTLKTVAIELDEKHGFCIPSLIGWRTSDQDRFFSEPLSSTSKKCDCCD